jgi:hypothetical protein
MAVQVHFVGIGLVRVAPDGTVYNASNSKRTIKEMLHFTDEHRVLVDSSIPNTAGNPTIQNYLNLEATNDFEPVQITQSFILTKKVTP